VAGPDGSAGSGHAGKRQRATTVAERGKFIQGAVPMRKHNAVQSCWALVVKQQGVVGAHTLCITILPATNRTVCVQVLPDASCGPDFTTEMKCSHTL
jgi:hypothetical protein